jgi:hypothetical protein
VTIILPQTAEGSFCSKPPLLHTAIETAWGQRPSGDQLQKKWNSFVASWGPSLRYFDPSGNEQPQALEFLSKYRCSTGASKGPVVNTLPDIWLYMSAAVVSYLQRICPQPTVRASVEIGLMRLAEELAACVRARRDPPRYFCDWIIAQDLVIVKISASEFNPRFGGARQVSSKACENLVAHAGLCYAFSSVPSP